MINSKHFVLKIFVVVFALLFSCEDPNANIRSPKIDVSNAEELF